jgi:hypothetical protein
MDESKKICPLPWDWSKLNEEPYEIHCDICDYLDACEYYQDGHCQVDFCFGCRYDPLCEIQTENCKAGHPIQCNNGYEPEADDWEDD